MKKILGPRSPSQSLLLALDHRSTSSRTSHLPPLFLLALKRLANAQANAVPFHFMFL